VGAGVVLVELHVAADGTVSDVCVIESAPPFDDAALDAARQFRFRAARVEGAPVPSYVYILFGFLPPITDETAR
jgi:TonB family protein